MKRENPSHEQDLGLVSAIKNGNTSLAISILDSIKDHPENLKAVLNAKDEDNEYTPLHLALDNCNTEITYKILEILRSIKGHPETIKAVLTAKDEDEYTPLHLALYKNNYESFHKIKTKITYKILEILESIKEDHETLKAVLTSKDSWGRTPLYWAISNKNTDMATKILEALNKGLRIPIHVEAYKGNTTELKKIFDDLTKSGKKEEIKSLLFKIENINPLYLAAQSQQTDIFNKLLECIKKIDDNHMILKTLLLTENNGGEILLNWAISNKWAIYNKDIASKILDSIKSDPETLKAVLTAKATGGQTPLHNAIYKKNTDTATIILESIKDHPETSKAILTAKDKYEKTPLHEALRNNREIAQNIINCVSPKEALELLLMTDNNGNTVFDRINASNSPFGSLTSIQLSLMGAGYAYVHINNEDELSSKAVYFASAAFIVVNKPDLKTQIPKEHQNKIISLTEKNEIEDMIRSMTFSDLVTDAKVFETTKLPRELTNIITEFTPSTIEQLQFWECLRKVPYHQNKATYQKRLKLAKLIIEYNNKFKDITKKLQQYYVNELNAVIQTLELKDNEWNPRAWAKSLGYKITVQSTSSNPEEEKQNHDTPSPSSYLFKQKPTEQATGDHEHEAQNITDPRQTPVIPNTTKSLSHNHGSSSLSDHSNHHQNLGNDNQDNLGGALPLISDNIQNSDINTNENTVSSTRENEVMSAQKNIKTENKGNKLYLILSLVFAVLSATLFILKSTIANFKAIKYSGWICLVISAIIAALAIFDYILVPANNKRPTNPQGSDATPAATSSNNNSPEAEKPLVPLTDFFNQPANGQAEEKKEDDNTTNSTMPASGSSSH